MGTTTRILMIVSNGYTHDPRVAAEAESLQRAGHEVHVIAWDRRGTLTAEETRNEVQVHRLRNTIGMRLRMYDIFRLPPFWRLAARQALRLHRQAPFGVVHCHDLDTLPAGVRIKRQAGIPLVYDVHEPFPDLMEQTPARRFAPQYRRMERRLASEVDLFVTINAPMEGYLRALAPAAPVVVVQNSKPLLWTTWEPPQTSRMRVLYLGTLDATRLVLPLAELATEEKTFELHVGGSGALEPQILRLAQGSEGHVVFLGLVPMEEVLPRTRAADVVVIMGDPNERQARIYGLPNKFFECLVAGRPVIVSKGTWIGGQVESLGCGLAVEFSKEALRAALRNLAEDPPLRERLGRTGLRLALEKYNWATDEAVLLDAYRRLGAGPQAAVHGTGGTAGARPPQG